MTDELKNVYNAEKQPIKALQEQIEIIDNNQLIESELSSEERIKHDKRYTKPFEDDGAYAD